MTCCNQSKESKSYLIHFEAQSGRTNKIKVDARSCLKAVLVGDTRVGKTCVLDRATADIFNDNACPTIGTAFKIHTFPTENGPVRLQIWDTAGQEQFRALSPMYYRSAQIALIFFDLTSQDSLKSVDQWCSELSEKASPEMPRVLVGNKADLADERCVSVEDAMEVLERNNMVFYAETSAKTGQGVVDLFQRTADYLQHAASENQNINMIPQMDFHQNRCC